MNYSKEGVYEILRATRDCIIAHKDQTRKGSTKPFSTHPIRAAELIIKDPIYGDVEIIQAALLHDVLEDTNYKLSGYSHRVMDLVKSVTDDPKLSKDEKRKEMVRRISLNPDAILIKMADRLSNVTDDTDHAVKYKTKPDVIASTKDILDAAKKLEMWDSRIYMQLHQIYWEEMYGKTEVSDV